MNIQNSWPRYTAGRSRVMQQCWCSDQGLVILRKWVEISGILCIILVFERGSRVPSLFRKWPGVCKTGQRGPEPCEWAGTRILFPWAPHIQASDSCTQCPICSCETTMAVWSGSCLERQQMRSLQAHFVLRCQVNVYWCWCFSDPSSAPVLVWM